MNSIVELFRELGVPGLAIALIVSLFVLIKYAFSIFKTLPHAVDTMKKIKGNLPEEIRGELDTLHKIETALNDGCPAEKAYASIQKKRMAAKCAKDAVRFLPSPQAVNMIIFLLCLAFSSLFGFFTYQSSEVVESNNITLNTIDLVFFLLSFICCAIFTLFLLYVAGCLLFGISAGSPIATAKRKWYWWRSRKAGYALHLSDA